MKDEITLKIVDEHHIWLNGRQYISLARVQQMIAEDRIRNVAESINAITVEWGKIKAKGMNNGRTE